ncbi:MAG: DNA polymerase III subunit gamma/tau [candidate division Zixibacteria bacterium HGW-Zixibacteria-1]|nr:MAG: DNA polymerase III subunit gamma/tau [candidate division Zixibacteria bacterium HGW-Zixibacteria-1]
MSYQVLARKYRPQQFDEIVAQEHVTRTLKNALKSGRVSSGYLFTGPRGTGKTTTARILAKALNCIDGPTPTPCGKCPSCKEIIASSSLDVLEIDAASNTGVDDIRTLRENVRYLPTSGKKRIYIIDEVHRLSGSAFDALLKTLEEPPPHVVFIFATTEPFKVPETIRSRTQRYDFHRVSVGNLSEHLKKIAESEKIEIDDGALFMVARKADGSVRDGMSLLDQMSAYAGEKITAQSVIEALGLIDRQFYFDYIAAIAAKDASLALEMIKKLVDSGIEIPEFCQGLADHFRHLLILQNAREPEKLLELSESEMESFQKQVDYFTSGDLLRMIKIITDMTIDLKSGIDPRLLLETNTLKLATMESTVLFEDILAHLSESEGIEDESEIESDLFGTPATSKPAPVHPTPENSPEPAPPPDPISIPGEVRAINLPMVQNSWPNYIESLKRSNPMLAALLAMAEIREVRDNVITAVFYNAGGTSKQVVEKPHYMSIISESLRDFFKTNLKVKFEVDLNKKNNIAPKASPQPEKLDTEKLLAEDDRLRNIVERFDGEVVGRKKVED